MELRAGDLVEVRDPGAILTTLDESGCLEGLPFMPEMVRHCGKRLLVSKRADKICDTSHYTGSRRLPDAVLLEELRCDGSQHGGCQAECRIFWKEAWLRKVEADGPPSSPVDPEAEQKLQALVARNAQRQREGNTVYRCQITELHFASTQLRSFDPRPLFREYATGNVSLGRFLRVGARAVIEEPLRKLHLLNEMPLKGKSSATPKDRSAPLGLQPGDLVEIRSPKEIEATLNDKGKNQGLWFDREMLPYCGGRYRIRSRVRRLIDEREGRLIELKTVCFTLEGVICSGDLSARRWLCPREIHSYWRESWLKRVEAPSAAASASAGT